MGPYLTHVRNRVDGLNSKSAGRSQPSLPCFNHRLDYLTPQTTSPSFARGMGSCGALRPSPCVLQLQNSGPHGPPSDGPIDNLHSKLIRVTSHPSVKLHGSRVHAFWARNSNAANAPRKGPFSKQFPTSTRYSVGSPGLLVGGADAATIAWDKQRDQRQTLRVLSTAWRVRIGSPDDAHGEPAGWAGSFPTWLAGG